MEVITEKREDRQMLMVMHLSQLLNFITGFGGIIVPLILWQVKKEEISNIDHHAKEIINFQISFYIYYTIAGLLCLVFIGVLILPVLAIISLVFPIINATKANNGEPINYPLTIEFLK